MNFLSPRKRCGIIFLRAYYIAALLPFTALTTQAQVYKWVDEQGNVHYSDSKPAQQQAEEKYYAGSQPSLDPELESYRKAIKQNELERQRQQSYEQQQRADAKEKAKQRKRYCDRLKSQQLIDNRVSMRRTQHPDGTLTVWTGEERKQYSKTLQDNYTKYCKK
ncbi:DUF4124 domain-containing protein [Dasania marina]|uniref:DUF4124 domain-containing protein n=1 Tax=Dasania marina TaxID=471499 RepID=UPI0030DB1F7D|tara:strand:- start:110338 stop:110826 length:489 start_codon:yes stop_codon:yes gene_type:complete